ncbi:MAG TPA: hypothetical protein VGY48_17375, partial [Vicinamibacterales bacterium]|nr:hypothetical protein [Vicinamibacterales bacterium]
MERQIVEAPVESSAPPDVARRYAAASDGLQGEIDQVIIGLPPIDPQSPAAQLTQPEGTRYLVQVGLGVIVACLLFELLATNAIARVGPQLEILGPEEVLLSAIGPARHGPFVLVLGDSVMTDVALRRTMGPAARAETIPAVIRSRAARYVGHDRIVNLSMEGALVNDYGGLSRLLFEQQLFPSAVLIQLDYRVLSPVHDADQNLSRRWLEAYVPTVERPVTGDPGSPEFAARPIDEWFTRTLLRSNAYVLMRGGRHRLNQRVLDTFEGWGLRQPASPQDTEVLKLLVGPFYRTDIPLSR